MTTNILHVFHDVDLRCGHNGLTEYASKHRVSIKNLVKDEFVVFLNKAQDKVKILSCDDLLVYLLSDGEISMQDIEAIPTYFAGNKFKFPKKLKLVKAA